MGTTQEHLNECLNKATGHCELFKQLFKVSKVHKLARDMCCTHANTFDLMNNELMQDKKCMFEFQCLNTEEVRRLLESLPTYGSAGTGNLDSKILKLAANHISGPIYHILNRSLIISKCFWQWKEGKIIPLSKDNRVIYSGHNSHCTSVLSVQVKSWKIFFMFKYRTTLL